MPPVVTTSCTSIPGTSLCRRDGQALTRSESGRAPHIVTPRQRRCRLSATLSAVLGRSPTVPAGPADRHGDWSGHVGICVPERGRRGACYRDRSCVYGFLHVPPPTALPARSGRDTGKMRWPSGFPCCAPYWSDNSASVANSSPDSTSAARGSRQRTMRSRPTTGCRRRRVPCAKWMRWSRPVLGGRSTTSRSPSTGCVQVATASADRAVTASPLAVLEAIPKTTVCLTCQPGATGVPADAAHESARRRPHGG